MSKKISTIAQKYLIPINNFIPFFLKQKPKVAYENGIFLFPFSCQGCEYTKPNNKISAEPCPGAGGHVYSISLHSAKRDSRRLFKDVLLVDGGCREVELVVDYLNDYFGLVDNESRGINMITGKVHFMYDHFHI
jgi:hypothetical protein